MESYNKILQAIYDAISEVNLSLDPQQRLASAPDTVLLGDGKLDSLQFLNLTVAVEESIERVFKKTVCVTDTALLNDEYEPLSVAALAQRIENVLNGAARAGATS